MGSQCHNLGGSRLLIGATTAVDTVVGAPDTISSARSEAPIPGRRSSGTRARAHERAQTKTSSRTSAPSTGRRGDLLPDPTPAAATAAVVTVTGVRGQDDRNRH